MSVAACTNWWVHLNYNYSITVVARVFPYGIVGERLRDVDASSVDQEINALKVFDGGPSPFCPVHKNEVGWGFQIFRFADVVRVGNHRWWSYSLVIYWLTLTAIDISTDDYLRDEATGTISQISNPSVASGGRIFGYFSHWIRRHINGIEVMI